MVRYFFVMVKLAWLLTAATLKTTTASLACEDDSCEIDRTSLLQLQQLQRASTAASTQAQSDCFHKAGGCGFSSDPTPKDEREQKKAEREQKQAEREQKKADREQKQAEREQKKAEREQKKAEENVEVEDTTTTPAAGRVENQRPTRPSTPPAGAPNTGAMEAGPPPGVVPPGDGASRAARWGSSE